MVYRVIDDADDRLDLGNRRDFYGSHDDTLILTRAWQADMGYPRYAYIATYGGDDAVTLESSEYIDVIVHTGAGNDTIRSTASTLFAAPGRGDDTVIGASGRDEFYFGSGTDFYDGRGGNDSIYFGFYNDESGIGHSLLRNRDDVICRLGVDYQVGDNSGTLLNIENVWSGDGDDVLIGTDETNVFYGFDGDDRMTGLAGNDEFHPGEGRTSSTAAPAATGSISAT